MLDPGLRVALERAAAAGPYFAVEPDPAAADGWRPLRTLVADVDMLAERVATARAFLVERTGGPVELRACASIDALGVVSRLVSPALATATLADVVPVLDLDTVHWQPSPGGPLPIAWAAGRATPTDTAEAAADALVAGVLGPVVTPLLDAYGTAFRVSEHVLWGNVASAAAGAAGLLPPAARDVVAALLTRPPLAGRGRYEDELGRRWFVRDNCCLFYRVPGGGRCGDCVLVPPAARTDARERAVD